MSTQKRTLLSINPKVLAKFRRQFWKKVKRDGEHWIFTGKARAGSLDYGSVRIPADFNWGRVNILAHRVAFFLIHGRWPKSTRHTCDIPLCIRPKHLKEGTQADNIRDALQRGRMRNGNIKLNPEIWKGIRNSKESSTILAKRYGVCSAHIRRIRRGQSGRFYRP